LDLRDETIVMLVFVITLIWLGLCFAVLRFILRMDARLIALGIVTAAAAIAYAALIGPATLLMRVAIVLVLGGVAYALLAGIRDPLAGTAGEPVFARKERTDG
jgi:hypothetical protein